LALEELDREKRFRSRGLRDPLHDISGSSLAPAPRTNFYRLPLLRVRLVSRLLATRLRVLSILALLLLIASLLVGILRILGHFARLLSLGIGHSMAPFGLLRDPRDCNGDAQRARRTARPASARPGALYNRTGCAPCISEGPCRSCCSSGCCSPAPCPRTS